MKLSYSRKEETGFTLVELLVCIGIVALLIGVTLSGLTYALDTARATASSSNLHELALANLNYAGDHDGFYCPAQEPRNLVRWHGARTSIGAPFDATKGFLSPYLGHDGKVKACPLFVNMLEGASSFEDGSGGYGYNEIYIGGTPQDNYTPTCVLRVPHPERTVMFSTTAFAKAQGLQEYPFCEAPQWVDPNGFLSGGLQASVHFRAHGKALVAWCDGHISSESPNQLPANDYYGGDSIKDQIGWFGPSDDNGYWNPNYQDSP